MYQLLSRIKLFLFCSSLLFSLNYSTAQIIQNITVDDGLPSNKIRSLYKAQNGIIWCGETFSDIKNAIFIGNEHSLNLEATISSDESGYVDMCAMSFCNAHVIANSSFSWWSAYLSGAPTVAPKTWFGIKGPQDWQDVYCDEWKLM